MDSLGRGRFGFPALKGPGDATAAAAAKPIAELFSAKEQAALSQSAAGLRGAAAGCRRPAAFLVRKGADGAVETAALSRWVEFFGGGEGGGGGGKPVVAVADPSGLSEHPGWPLRNLLVLLAYHFGGGEPLDVTVVAFREVVRDGAADLSGSLVLDLTVPGGDPAAWCTDGMPNHFKGLEKDAKQKLRPRLCNLSASMEPTQLAESAVGLNLSLMRWRLMPQVDLEKVAGTRCLLLGAGTLGCNVARLLLGWGVKTISFIDSGNVSYSNPVRQTLFTFEDCLNGGRPKATAAAERLAAVYPGVRATGHVMSIPMPGHAVSGATEKAARESSRKLESLIDEHDAVFLLTDSREARWLATLICAKKNKICLTAAVGFDTFVAMRHGVRADGEGTAPTVGCYFCNDVVAPVNSTKDRSLDQQCTVSRPGLSMAVSAAIVELLISLIHHPLGAAAPHLPEADQAAQTDQADQDGYGSPIPYSSPMGAVPHQIRGFLAGFQQMPIGGQAFDCCTACSAKVVTEYTARGEDFLIEAFNSPDYLEELTGLADMRRAADDLGDFSWDEDEDEDGGDDF